MNVILLEDVEKLGASHEVVDVADGYARNFLLPRGLAAPATKSAMANLENERKVAERRIQRLRAGAEEQAKLLDGKTLVLDVKIGTGGRLYGSIGNADIAAEIKKVLGVELDRKQVILPEAIRTTGLHIVPLNLHRDVKASINIQIGDVVETPAVEAPVAEAVAA